MHPKPPLFLPLLDLSYGFDAGKLVELRFNVEHSRGSSTLRLRGMKPITDAIAHIGARSNDDIERAYACIDDCHIGYLEMCGSNLVNANQAISALETYAVMAEHSGLSHAAADAREQILAINVEQIAA